MNLNQTLQTYDYNGTHDKKQLKFINVIKTVTISKKKKSNKEKQNGKII